VRLVLVGPPGSGKGTQGPAIADRLGVPYLSTGDVLRAQVEAGTDLGRQVATLIDRGELVPDDLMVALVAAALADRSTSAGYVLDGFPRTLTQARAIECTSSPLAAPEVVVHLALPDDVLFERLDRRAREEGRADDDRSVIERRLRVYADETEPLLDHYRQRGSLVTVDGDRPPAEVTAAILAALTPAEAEG
jgi:adenylate kinase